LQTLTFSIEVDWRTVTGTVADINQELIQLQRACTQVHRIGRSPGDSFSELPGRMTSLRFALPHLARR